MCEFSNVVEPWITGEVAQGIHADFAGDFWWRAMEMERIFHGLLWVTACPPRAKGAANPQRSLTGVPFQQLPSQPR
jgi:hypothetical protein